MNNLPSFESKRYPRWAPAVSTEIRISFLTNPSKSTSPEIAREAFITEAKSSAAPVLLSSVRNGMDVLPADRDAVGVPAI